MADGRDALPVLRAGRPPLVGRARQLALLAEHLTNVATVRPNVVLVVGAPGIGKTRLLEEFPPAELGGSVTVLRGSASQAEGMPPYLPFLEALGAYIAAAPTEVLREQVGSLAASLVALLPEIPARLGSAEPMHPLGPEQERHRLYEAVAAFLAAVAASAPLALLLDDLQWADAATFDLLVHVAGRARSSALLIVGACREGEAGENAALVRALAELNRRRLLVTVPLRPLEAEASRALAANLLQGDLAPAAASVIHRQGEGNPFFLEELLRALVEDGTLIWQRGRWELSSQPRRVLPPRAAEAIRMRLSHLDPSVVTLLQVAAVVGRTSEPALLAGVAGIDEEQAEEGLLAAARAHLMRREAGGGYTFAHDMVRETLYADIGSVRRGRLHQSIGDVLEAQGGARSARRQADLAFHFAEAGDAARGVGYALASGEQALAASAGVEAMAQFRTAIRLLGPDGEPRRRAAALMGLGNAAMLAGSYQQAAEAYQSAQEAWKLGGDATAAGKAWQLLGRARWRQEAVIEAADALGRALELQGPADSQDVAETLLLLADLHVTSLGRHAEGIAYAERALEMVERLGDKKLEARANCVVGNARARSGDLEAGRLWLERALALGQQLDDPAIIAETCAYLANIAAWTGDPDRSRELSLLRAESAGRTHDPFDLRHVYTWLGSIETHQGNWSRAEQFFARQEQILDGLESPEPRAILGAFRGLLGFYRGRFEEAEREYRAAAEAVQPAGPGGLVWYLGQWGLVLAELGRRDAALECLAELHALAEPLHERASARLCALAYLAVGYARLGARERAADCYPKLLPFQGLFAPVPVDRALGLAARDGGDLAAARRHLADAETRTRRARMRPELALILLERSLLEREHSGGVERSSVAPRGKDGGPLAEGLRLCEELGMQELGRRILGPTATGPTGRPRGPEGVAGLSARELEVLRLVAQGLTNREIAESLVLSANTVARHLTHIFTKTGVENRAGAVAFALRHGLA